MWPGSITKSLTALLGNTMREELYEINSQLKVVTSIESVLCAVDKEFCLCDNYSKGRGELFREWIETYHPGALIFHIKRALGYCQYLSAKGE